MRFSEFNDVTCSTFSIVVFIFVLALTLLLTFEHRYTIPFLCSIDIYCPFIKLNNMFTQFKGFTGTTFPSQVSISFRFIFNIQIKFPSFSWLPSWNYNFELNQKTEISKFKRNFQVFPFTVDYGFPFLVRKWWMC